MEAMIAALLLVLVQNPQGEWPVHSMERPRPPVVKPGPAMPPVTPPADAIILFNGTSLREWRAEDSSAAKWVLRPAGRYVEVASGTGSLISKRAFGDVQLHIEWRTPVPAEGEGQDRGNSGVYLMGRYEVQVLDSYHNDTYPDGQAGSLFGQNPPLVNVARPPGEWQTYDIVFRRPRFRADSTVERPARMTVFWNGVLVQDNFELVGQTVFGRKATYSPHADKLPISLQDHSHPVRYRNVWVRELPELP
jgi:hypothetical protein